MRMLLVPVVVLLASILVAAQTASRPSQVAKIANFNDDRPSTVILGDGSRFVTTLYDVKLLGELQTLRKSPYLVMAGRGCFACDANISVYIHSVSDGPMSNEGNQPRFSYPGHEKDHENDQALYDGRMFIGDCLQDYNNAVVWHEKVLLENGQWESGVFVVQVRADALSKALLRDNAPPISQTIARVKQGRCKEVPGMDRHSEP